MKLNTKLCLILLICFSIAMDSQQDTPSKDKTKMPIYKEKNFISPQSNNSNKSSAQKSHQNSSSNSKNLKKKSRQFTLSANSSPPKSGEMHNSNNILNMETKDALAMTPPNKLPKKNLFAGGYFDQDDSETNSPDNRLLSMELKEQNKVDKMTSPDEDDMGDIYFRSDFNKNVNNEESDINDKLTFTPPRDNTYVGDRFLKGPGYQYAPKKFDHQNYIEDQMEMILSDVVKKTEELQGDEFLLVRYETMLYKITQAFVFGGCSTVKASGPSNYIHQCFELYANTSTELQDSEASKVQSFMVDSKYIFYLDNEIDVQLNFFTNFTVSKLKVYILDTQNDIAGRNLQVYGNLDVFQVDRNIPVIISGSRDFIVRVLSTDQEIVTPCLVTNLTIRVFDDVDRAFKKLDYNAIFNPPPKVSTVFWNPVLVKGIKQLTMFFADNYAFGEQVSLYQWVNFFQQINAPENQAGPNHIETLTIISQSTGAEIEAVDISMFTHVVHLRVYNVKTVHTAVDANGHLIRLRSLQKITCLDDNVHVITDGTIYLNIFGLNMQMQNPFNQGLGNEMTNESDDQMNDDDNIQAYNMSPPRIHTLNIKKNSRKSSNSNSPQSSNQTFEKDDLSPKVKKLKGDKSNMNIPSSLRYGVQQPTNEKMSNNILNPYANRTNRQNQLGVQIIVAMLQYFAVQQRRPPLHTFEHPLPLPKKFGGIVTQNSKRNKEDCEVLAALVEEKFIELQTQRRLSQYKLIGLFRSFPELRTFHFHRTAGDVEFTLDLTQFRVNPKEADTYKQTEQEKIERAKAYNKTKKENQ